MRMELTSGALTTQAADWIVVGAHPEGALTPQAGALDAAMQGAIGRAVARGDLGKAAGATLLIGEPSGLATTRLLVVGLGPRDAFGDKAWRQAVAAAARLLSEAAGGTAYVTLADIDVPGRDTAWKIREAARVLADGFYRFALPDAQRKTAGVDHIALHVAQAANGPDHAAMAQGLAVADGLRLTRDLGNLPGNICNPDHFAKVARDWGTEFGCDVDVLERADIEALGMGSFLSVGRASANPCKLIAMHHRGGKPGDKPVVLLGKGITFDTGGISLKPGANLDEMKFDMSGAGSVFGTMRTIALLKLPLNVVGLIAAAENMPGGNASRPGDVVRSMSGRTIEILNTDAEGRLLLCDALTYAERFEPACVVDIATLTGACVIALGAHASGLFANADGLADELLASGTRTGDRAWRMPLWDDYMSQLRSNFADISNLGGPPAGSVTAALFLAEFARAYPWAHLDIAGTASVSGEAKGSTGRPVPLLTDFLMARAAS
jgi:leucyl aminopeptidase